METSIWVGIFVCLLHSAMFSGLNLAFFSLSRLRLENASGRKWVILVDEPGRPQLVLDADSPPGQIIERLKGGASEEHAAGYLALSLPPFFSRGAHDPC